MVSEGQFDTPKTKRSRRVVPLSPVAVQILGLQKQGSGTALIFSSATGTALCRRNLLSRQFRPAAAKLGHTSSEVTLEHYIHAVSSESRNAVGWIEEFIDWTKSSPRVKKPKALAS